jgi:hypothetical protein
LAKAEGKGRSIPLRPVPLPPYTLVAFTIAGLIGAWWLSLRMLVETPVMDLTVPKIVVLAGIVLCLAAGAWRSLSWRDLPVVAVGAALLVWLVVTALLRRDSTDFKLAVAFAVFAGGAFAVTFAAVRFDGDRALRAVAVALEVVTAITFCSVVIERVVYMSGVGDQFVWLWGIFRPQSTFNDPILGTLAATPAYFISGGLLRASGFFAHPNYQAFFAVLVGPFFAIRFAHSLDRRDRNGAVLNGLLLAATMLIGLWTYSRTGVVGMLGSTGLAVLIDRAATRRSEGRLFGVSIAPALGVAIVVVATLGAGTLQDLDAARRLSTVGDVTIASGDSGGDSGGVVSPGDVQGSAVRSQDIRFQMQKAAVNLVTQSASDMLIGPGVTDYQKQTHDSQSSVYVSQAGGIRDPNSSWLSIALAGGAPALVLFALTLLAALAAAVRAIRSTTGPAREMAIWLTAWIVAWSGAQIFGTYPFATSESILLGTLLGLASALLPRRFALQDR